MNRSAFVRAVGVVALIALAPASLFAQEPLLWGSLKPGPHAVGYRTLYQLDHTRRYDPEYSTDAKPAPRPILVCVWYPAKATAGKPMAYREYLDVPSDDPRIAPFAKRLAAHVREVVCEETMGKKPAELNATQTAAFERLLAAKTVAVKDAVAAADGPFPVVIHHPGLGGTHDDNAVLFEYLASHGYVVLSSAYPMANANRMNLDWDLARSFRDLEFLARSAAGLPFADPDRLGVMGQSYGGQAAVAWAAEPSSAVRAVVTLDSGLENVSLDYPGIKKLKDHFEANRRNARAASLRFASRENDPKFDHLHRYLKFAPGYGVVVDGLTHNDYLSQGAVRPALRPDEWPDAKAKAVRRGYDRVCEHTLQFLDMTLKGSARAKEFLERSVRGDGLDDAFRLVFRPAAPAPPTARQLAPFVRKHGVEKAVELIRDYRDDIEVGGDGVGGAVQLLMDDGRMTDAVALITRSADIFPKSMAIRFRLGQVLALTDDKAGALAAYRTALDLVAGETADEPTKARWRKELEAKVKEVGGGDGRR